MKITNHIATTYGLDIQKAAGNNKAVEKTDKARKTDSVDVSKAAKSLTDTQSSVETASNRIAALPETREDRVAAVKERIKEGFYDTEKFRGELAEKLIKTFTSPIQ